MIWWKEDDNSGMNKAAFNKWNVNKNNSQKFNWINSILDFVESEWRIYFHHSQKMWSEKTNRCEQFA